MSELEPPTSGPASGPEISHVGESRAGGNGVSEGSDLDPLVIGKVEEMERVVAAARTQPLGPGMVESLAWLIGVVAAQLIGAFGVLAAVVLMQLSMLDQTVSVPAFLKSLTVRMHDMIPLLVAGGQVGLLLFAIVGVRLRWGRNAWTIINPRRPGWLHLLLTVALVLPVSVIGTQAMRLTASWSVAPHEDLKAVFAQLGELPFGTLVLVIALCPAVAEELIFRGVVGRGTVNRYGVILGVSVTALLFAVAHMNVAQAAGVIPLSITMHAVYLATDSIWAPILLHFLNNFWAAVLLKYPEAFGRLAVLAEAKTLPNELLLAAVAAVVGIFCLLWLTRSEANGWLFPEETERLTAHLSEEGRRVRLATTGVLINLIGFVLVVWQVTSRTG